MKLVTVVIPVYRRFDFLPKAIQCVASQDYPHIQLIVSDNGQNGTRVPEIVRQHYPGLFRFRQNPVPVPIATHFNQLLREAAGEYHVVLCDDDEISSNYISEMVGLLEFARAHPGQWAGLKKQLRRMTWETYLDRLESIYRKRLSWPSWFRAAFAMPFIPAYYCALFRSLIREIRTAAVTSLKKLLPGAYRIYRSLRYREGT